MLQRRLPYLSPLRDAAALALLGATVAMLDGCVLGGPGGVPGAPIDTGAAGGSSLSGHGGAAGEGGSDSGGLGAGGAGPGSGSWDDPFVLTLPFVVAGDTSAATSSLADAYTPCAPTANEAGPEIVYRLVVAETGWLEVELDDEPGDSVDLDVHLLGAPSPASCAARDDVRVGMTVGPGEYWISVDSWVDGNGAALAGPFVLSGALVTDADACFVCPISCEADDMPYVNAVLAEEPGDPGCPDGMARVATFCIDRYEAMLVAELPGGELGPWSPYENPGDTAVSARSVAGVVPQGYIDQVQAEQACLAAGKRLCTDAEWLRACRGPQQTTYPYGDQLLAGVCNDARSCHPVVQYFETDAAWIWSELANPCIDQLPDGLALTGAHPGCESVEGAFDLMGNLHEWTADPNGTFRGGFYVDTVINGLGCLYATTAHNVWHWDYSTGFRCCADAS